ncbi:putative Regulator of chromosome condensation 1/beta-lactamase-inhibitor protein II [Seiridium cardinale]
MAPRKTTAASTAASAKASSTAKSTKSAAATKKSTTAAKPSRTRKAPKVVSASENSQESSEEVTGSGEEDSEEAEPVKPASKKKAAATKKAPAAKKAATTEKAVKKEPAATKKLATRPKIEAEEEEKTSSKSKTKKPAPASKAEEAKKKRKARDGEDDHKPVVKRVRTAPVPAVGKAINEAPQHKLDIFVFGEGTSGELGLGSRKYDGKKPVDVKRPRINHNLTAGDVGVVQIACGGMHVVALTHDDRILTWGVNDDRALGRDTTWAGGVRDVDDSDSDDDDDDDTGMNPNESTPGEVDFTDIKLPGTQFVQIVATDSASFVLTADGRVYGWGTFRGSDGIIGFSDDVRIQQVPIMIDGLKNITRLAAGANHVLALDLDGKVFTWGSGGQYQLGRKAITRGKNSGLKPEPCGKFNSKHYAVDIAAGSYHSFYIDNYGAVWAWGLNNYSQTGHSDDTGKDDAMVLVPRPVDALDGRKIVSIDGGEHHSVAATAAGELITWGRVDGHQVGQQTSVYNEHNTVFDSTGRPRILTEPTAIRDIKTNFVAAGTDNSFALTEEGSVYSWGFSANYQTGQGTTDDIEVPTVINNTAIRDRHITWAGAGGQYSILAALQDEVPNGVVNGH